MSSPLVTKLLRAGDPNRISRFHSARGDPVPWRCWPHLLPALGWLVFSRCTGRRPARPWIGYSAARELARRLTPAATVLEIGGGMSTLWLARRCRRLVTYEADPVWCGQLREMIRARGLGNVELHHRWMAQEMADFGAFADRSLDLVFIDGGPREWCVRSSFAKVRPGGAVYVDNTDVPGIAGRSRELLLAHAQATRAGVRHFVDFVPALPYVTEGTLLVVPTAEPDAL